MRALSLLTLSLLAFCAPGLALAQIHQPTGDLVPAEPGCAAGRPTGLLAAFACVCTEPGICNIGDPCPTETTCPDGRNGTCESRMYHVFNDNACIPSQHEGLDPRRDASLTPETFSATCPLTFTLETRGRTAFRNAFGWYHATGSPPSPDDLHVVFPCDAPEGATVELDLRRDPAYRGGAIGFFLLTPQSRTSSECAAGDCCASVDRLRVGMGYAYYSQRTLNPDARGDESFIHLLLYRSRIFNRSTYFAWDDQFDAADDDFTDLVVRVRGVDCAGAGADCDTGMLGACRHGITRCEDDGAFVCTPRFAAAPERCNGLDDDCDGRFDEGAPCADGLVCERGACRARCDEGRSCDGARSECDTGTGRCREPACRDVACPAGRVCREGVCEDDCAGIVCPAGLTCAQDACIDACASAECPAGTVCRDGHCLPGCGECDGVLCESHEICRDDGECRHPDCPMSCPAGEVCDRFGACQDACEGAVCPRGEACRVGRCEVRAVVDAGTSPSDGGAADAGSGAARSGCSCGVEAEQSGSPRALGALLLLAVAHRRRRRARRATERRRATVD